MTRLNDLYRKAEEMNIQVIRCSMNSLQAVSTPDNFIGIDPDKLGDREELVCLAHEMGHCVTGSFYTSDTPIPARARLEQRADRWAIRQLVPLEELNVLLQGGVRRWDEAAEHFQVTEDFMRKAVAFYRDARGLM